jgi:hypothetical protein
METGISGVEVIVPLYRGKGRGGDHARKRGCRRRFHEEGWRLLYGRALNTVAPVLTIRVGVRLGSLCLRATRGHGPPVEARPLGYGEPRVVNPVPLNRKGDADGSERDLQGNQPHAVHEPLTPL